MKLFFIILLFSVSVTVNANTYYVSSTGSDSNSGLTEVLAWQTITKVNSFPFSPGDQILFKRGDTFYGKLVISNSGSSGNTITYGTYGFGDAPVISGFATVSSWTDLGFNVWQSNAVSTLSNCNVVLIDGMNTAMGRTPNSGYWTYQNNTSYSITSTSLNASTMNWAGAQVVIKKERYVIDRPTITSASGSSVYFVNPSGYNGHPNWGFFIQNDTRTLDSQNEWYYSSADKKISVYSVGSPTNVKLATRDTLVYIVGKSYITLDGLSFTGANGQAVYLGNSSYVTIKNCEFDFNFNAIKGYQFGGTSSSLLIDSCSFNHTNNDAINLPSEFAGATITHNTIDNTAIFEGMAANGQSRWGINVTGANYTIQYNTVRNAGYVGIGFNGSAVLVDKNRVDSFCIITDDGGGIYTGNVQTGVAISNNIVTNGIGNSEGTNGSNKAAYGIYLDDLSSGMSVLNNSVGNISNAAIYLHQAKNITVKGNTTFNSRVGLFVSNDNTDLTYHTTGLDVKQNAFIATTIGADFTIENQLCMSLASRSNDLAGYGAIDSNILARPIDDTKTMWWTLYGVSDSKYTLPEWQLYSGYDLHSTRSPKTVDNTDSLIFVYNPTGSDSVITLPYNYIDPASTSYNGTITLSAYSSKVLIQNGSVTGGAPPPIVNAGNDTTIYLGGQVTLNGGVESASGHTSTYLWTFQTGSGTFSDATVLNPIVSGISLGNSTLRLTATQNDAQTQYGEVQINVLNPISQKLHIKGLLKFKNSE